MKSNPHRMPCVLLSALVSCLYVAPAWAQRAASVGATNCEQAQASVAALLDENLGNLEDPGDLTDLYQELRAKTRAEQRAAARQMSPTQLSGVWRLHFLETLRHRSLSGTQCDLLGQIAHKLSPHAYSGENPELRTELDELFLVSRVVFPKELHREIFVNMGVESDPGEQAEKICAVIKSPQLRELVCSDISAGSPADAPDS